RTLDFCIPRYGETHFWERAEAVPNRNLEASPVRNVAIGLMGTLFLLSGAGMYYLLAPPAPPAAPPTALPSAKPAPPEETAGPPARVTYGPLCGAGAVYARGGTGKVVDCDHRGWIYEEAFLFYDFKSAGPWVQATGEAVDGRLKGARLERLPATQTTWERWK